MCDRRWNIVCRDGRARHFPYANESDAAEDAEIWSREGMTCTSYPPNYSDRQMIEVLGKCPGGSHRVEEGRLD